MARSPFLSVVIPCFDEISNLKKGVLENVIGFLKSKKFSYEIIVVDDGSHDGSIKFLEDVSKKHPEITILKNPHLGKAGAVTTGVLAANGEYVLFTDMDQATPIDEIDKLLPYFDEQYDIVIGSRNNERKGSPWTRLIMSRAWMLLRNIMIGLSIKDTQCGFKMFSRKSAQKLFTKMQQIHHGFQTVSGSSVTAGFDVELLYLAQKMGYKIKEVPVKWLYVETRRVNPIKDSLDGFFYLLLIRMNQATGKY